MFTDKLNLPWLPYAWNLRNDRNFSTLHHFTVSWKLQTKSQPSFVLLLCSHAINTQSLGRAAAIHLRKSSLGALYPSGPTIIRYPLPRSTCTRDRSTMFRMSELIRWLQRKRYQYEVTFSLYMMTPTEKFIFSTSLLALISIPDF